jgi:hypothetical protein
MPTGSRDMTGVLGTQGVVRRALGRDDVLTCSWVMTEAARAVVLHDEGSSQARAARQSWKSTSMSSLQVGTSISALV